MDPTTKINTTLRTVPNDVVAHIMSMCTVIDHDRLARTSTLHLRLSRLPCASPASILLSTTLPFSLSTWHWLRPSQMTVYSMATLHLSLSSSSHHHHHRHLSRLTTLHVDNTRNISSLLEVVSTHAPLLTTLQCYGVYLDKSAATLEWPSGLTWLEVGVAHGEYIGPKESSRSGVHLGVVDVDTISRRCTRLRRLLLHGLNGVRNHEPLCIVFPHLEHLAVRCGYGGVKFTQRTLQWLTQTTFLALPRLVHLRFGTPYEVEDMRGLSCFTQLTALHLEGVTTPFSSIDADGFPLPPLRSLVWLPEPLVSLKALSVTWTASLTYTPLEELIPESYATLLTELHLGNCLLSRYQCATFALRFSRLRHITLYRASLPLSADYGDTICGLCQHMPSLRTLSVQTSGMLRSTHIPTWNVKVIRDHLQSLSFPYLRYHELAAIPTIACVPRDMLDGRLF